LAFDAEDDFHISLLYSIYKKFTGEEDVSVKRFGSHWKKIGFVSRDPIKSLRLNNVGILGLI